MGKYKQYLMAQDENLDVTDPKDSFSPPDEPSAQDWYMHDLMTACINLGENIPYGYEKEIDGCIETLQNMRKLMEKPF